jgi:hypothetical protein
MSKQSKYQYTDTNEITIDNETDHYNETNEHIIKSVKILKKLYKHFNTIDLVNDDKKFKYDFDDLSTRFLVQLQDLVDNRLLYNYGNTDLINKMRLMYF